MTDTLHPNDSAISLFESLRRSETLVNSGVYQLFIPGSRTEMNNLGLPELILPDRPLTPDEAKTALAVSAFSTSATSEDTIATSLFADEARIVHPVAGHVVGSYAGAVTNESHRATSSSGGLTTWLLVKLLREGRIDAVIHMKQDRQNPGTFSYQISRSEEEIRDGSKTRYFPGEMSDPLLQARSSSESFAVVGIPTLLYELRLATRHDADLQKRLRYFVGIVCGHQKSARYAEALAWQFGVAPGKLVDIDFRAKLADRPASKYGVSVVGHSSDGRIIQATRPASELYGTDWGLGLFKAPYSDYSDDVFNETADVVLGDAWLPEYLDDSRGHNILLTRTRELDELFRAAAASGEITLDELPVERVIQSQSGLVRHGRELLPTRMKYLAAKSGTIRAPRFPVQPRAGALRSRVQRIRVGMARDSHLNFARSASQGDFSLFVNSMAPLVRKYERLYRLAGLAPRVRQWLRR